MKRRTCNELGVCQACVPACPDCPERYRIMLPRPYLVPGVIDGPSRPASPVADELKATTAYLMGPHS